MAKLEGVKVIDMVGGEVTKIAYEGEEYVKVDGVGKAGDIATVVKPWGTLKLGDAFSVEEILRRGDHHRAYVRLLGNRVVGYVDDVDYFRKTSAKPTLTDRVDELETRVSALEEGGKAPESLVGKFAKFNRGGLYVTKGEYYEIVDTDEDGVTIFDDVGDRHWWDYPSDDYEIVDEKPSQVIEGDPQVGDKIRIVNAGITFGDYKNGDIHTVVRLRNDVEKGAVDIDVKNSAHVLREEFEIISRPEKAEEPALKVGDYAKVIDDSNIYNAGSIRADEIVEIIKDDKSGVPYYIKSVTSGATVWAKSSHIVKATDEEVAEAKRKLAEEQKAEAEAKKWAEIGRKPNEFKEGDIVVAKHYVSSRKLTGQIEDNGEKLLGIRALHNRNYNAVAIESAQLITPVERRFDR